MTTAVHMKTWLKARIGERQIRKIAYAGWLTSKNGPRPNPTLRSLVPPFRSRALLFAYHAWRRQFRIPGRMYVPAPPIAKVCAIRWYAQHYGVRFFVETGTYLGDTTAGVANLFERCWTIELSEGLHRRASRRFSGTNIDCLQGDSGILIPKILASLSAPALFWLDAHASGGITADAGYDPLFTELEAILGSPARHVILIDDVGGRFEAIYHRTARTHGCVIKNDIIRLLPL